VVLGHGLGGVREMRLGGYAERFAEAGIASLAFTYRHFGDSGGDPRQLISISRQHQDWDAAIDFAKHVSEIDSKRIAIWGTSLGGGHVIEVAANHPELLAAVSQCPFTDGIQSARRVSRLTTLKLVPSIAQDLLSSFVGMSPKLVPLVGGIGTAAFMTARDAQSGYLALIPEGTEVVNLATARSLVDIIAYRPGRSASRVKEPILFCISETDSVAPAGPTLKYALEAPRGEVRSYPAGHFDFYVGEAFQRLVADQTRFLVRHLVDEPGDSRH
jgi:fermentation-respiration switch protein FrsA (DUF1100 family)